MNLRYWWHEARDLFSRDIVSQTQSPWCQWRGSGGQRYGFLWEWDEEDPEDVPFPTLLIVERIYVFHDWRVIVAMGTGEAHVVLASREVPNPF